MLLPGGAIYVAYTNRVFPTKAVAVWRACSDAERTQLIGGYLAEAGGYTNFTAERLVEGGTGFDPLYVVSVRRAWGGTGTLADLHRGARTCPLLAKRRH